MPKINLTDLSNLQNEVTATSAINNNNTIIEEAIENSISRDGTQPNQMNSVLDMNSNRIINLPDAISDQEPVSYAQFVDGITSVDNGAVIDGEFVTLSHNPTMLAERVLIAGSSLEITDGGPKGDVSIGVSSAELNALATTGSAADKLPYYDGVGSAAITDFTPYARTLVDDVDATTARATLGVTLGTDVQPHSDLLDSLNASGTGIVAKTTSITIAPRTVTGTANEISVSNGDGVLGNPTLNLPNSLTFTGKTITGGSFSSPSVTTPTGIVKGDVGLGNVDNTSDLNKPISTATQTALDAKVTGPASAVSANIPTFNGTTGKLIQDSGKVLPSGTVVGTTDTQTLTNKTIVGSSNSLSAIPVTSLSVTGTPNGLKFLRDDASWQIVPGGGDLISTNNLSDVANVETSRSNLRVQNGLNPIINSDFTLWQRDSFFTNPVDFTRLADRWNVSYNGVGGDFTISQIDMTFLSGTIPGNPRYGLLYQQTVAGSGNTFFDISTQIEDVGRFAGQDITISAWVYFSVAGDLKIITEQFFGSGGSPSPSEFTTGVIPISAAVWTPVSFTTKPAHIAAKTRGTNGDDTFNVIFNFPVNKVQSCYLAAPMLNTGFNPVPWYPNPGNYDAAANQRYFQKSYSSTTNPGVPSFSGSFLTTASSAYVPLRCAMRKNPFVTLYSPSTGAAGYWWDSTAGVDRAAVAQDIGETGFSVSVSGAVPGNFLSGHWVADAEY